MKLEDVIQKEVLDIELAVYSSIWRLPNRYFKACRRVFLLDLTVGKFLDSINVTHSFEDILLHEDEEWIIRYHQCSSEYIDNYMSKDDRLLISCRNKIYLSTSKELKFALVTPYHEHYKEEAERKKESFKNG